MKIIDNINSLLGDDLKASIHSKAKLKIAASCFSIFVYEDHFRGVTKMVRGFNPIEFDGVREAGR